MLTTMRLTFMSEDVKEAMDQTVDAFGVSLAHLAEHEPRFEKISELAFCFGVAHPVLQPPGKGGASYSRDSGILFTQAYLDHDAWIGDRWGDRVRAVAEAAEVALSSVHKTRLTSEERSTLLRLIENVAERLAASPPGHRLSLKPVYASEDKFGQKLSIGFQPPGAFASVVANQRTVELQPEEIHAYLKRHDDAVPATQMVKLYKRHDGWLLYREAWIDGENVVEHVGVYGELGLTSQHAASGAVRQREVINAIAAEAKADGFNAVPEARLVGLLVSKEIPGAGTKNDLRRRHALEDFLNEVTGWRGLGHCDGGSIGSGSMEAFCLVVDYKIAAEVIERELASSQFNDFIVRRVSR
ncbi:hypothetical protein [Brevundimonas aurifodinae]|uniref:Uncharacterized protein n=2 Tax=Brevundimonas TaxID=41275 RepID=A0ABV1NSE6_9CAUL|nr:MAG: hypothetical protein B7Z42_15985 [Brevundimonas sp. 12-68-7]OYX29858.1 MAG: hypothetical protein B7Z01_15215 [Brevundimonas subvibrioides]